MADQTEVIRDRVRAAFESDTPLCIEGGGTKRFLGRAPAGEPLKVGEHRGVVNHAPSELVLTVRAGTPVADTQAALAEHGQWLAFDPPRHEKASTIGGVVACALSGPGPAVDRRGARFRARNAHRQWSRRRALVRRRGYEERRRLRRLAPHGGGARHPGGAARGLVQAPPAPRLGPDAGPRADRRRSDPAPDRMGAGAAPDPRCLPRRRTPPRTARRSAGLRRGGRGADRRRARGWVPVGEPPRPPPPVLRERGGWAAGLAALRSRPRAPP